MKKLSFILAVALTTFTITACGEKAPTPEEQRIAAAIKNRDERAEQVKATIDTFNMDTTGKSEEEKEKIKKAKRAFIKSLTTPPK